MNLSRHKIVVSGGPGAGKTTALDLFRRELAQVEIVPEAATMLFEYGLKREVEAERVKLLQQSIYQTQLTMEETFHRMHAGSLLICDRGTLDGLAYWPDTEEDFFQAIQSSYEAELARYEAVIFFQSGAGHRGADLSNNPFRNESSELAHRLDQKLMKVWQRHPNFHYVSSDSSFMKKINAGINTINQVLEKLQRRG